MLAIFYITAFLSPHKGLLGLLSLTLAFILYSKVALRADPNYSALLEQDEDEKKEKPKGRYKTVACEGPGFHNWKTYCCQESEENKKWDNCPDAGTCKAPTIYNGC